MPLIRPAIAEDLPQVGTSLAAAFDGDPVWGWLASPRANWSRRAAAWFATEARLQLEGHGEVFVRFSNELDGCGPVGRQPFFQGHHRRMLQAFGHAHRHAAARRPGRANARHHVKKIIVGMHTNTKPRNGQVAA